MPVVIHSIDSDIFVASGEVAGVQKVDRGDDVYRIKIYLKNGTTIETIVEGWDSARRVMSKLYKAMKGE